MNNSDYDEEIASNFNKCIDTLKWWYKWYNPLILLLAVILNSF